MIHGMHIIVVLPISCEVSLHGQLLKESSGSYLTKHHRLHWSSLMMKRDGFHHNSLHQIHSSCFRKTVAEFLDSIVSSKNKYGMEWDGTLTPEQSPQLEA
jgi:hypothetical protein